MWIVRLVPTSQKGISGSWRRRSNPISSRPGTSMSYAVKEIFYTLQGEGAQTGRPAVFCRFAGCNLWSGREEDRSRAVCQFCDTDFVGTDGTGGGRFDTAETLAAAIAKTWPQYRGYSKPFVVCTGGEPLLQLDQPLIDAVHKVGFEIAIETNGTQTASPDIDWICVSPKSTGGTETPFRTRTETCFPSRRCRARTIRATRFSAFFPSTNGWCRP